MWITWGVFWTNVKKLNSGVLEITLSFQDQLGIKNYRCAQSIIKEKSRHGEYKLEVSCQNIRIDQGAELGYKRGQAKKNNASSDTLLLRKWKEWSTSLTKIWRILCLHGP